MARTHKQASNSQADVKSKVGLLPSPHTIHLPPTLYINLIKGTGTFVRGEGVGGRLTIDRGWGWVDLGGRGRENTLHYTYTSQWLSSYWLLPISMLYSVFIARTLSRPITVVGFYFIFFFLFFSCTGVPRETPQGGGVFFSLFRWG